MGRLLRMQPQQTSHDHQKRSLEGWRKAALRQEAPKIYGGISPAEAGPVRFRDFKLERYFGEWEFTARILLGSSDPESMRLPELLALADEDGHRRWDELWLGYTESPGLPALREAIAEGFDTCDPEEVLVFSAPEEAIFHVASAVLEPGDQMVGITPAYQSSYEVPRSAGAEITLVPLRADHGWTLDLDELADAVTGRTKLIYVSFPHNPTGAML